MSWVLILMPRSTYKHINMPAVIGGYPTKEAAEEAGRFATVADGAEEMSTEWYFRDWEAFSVIPGAADQGPETS